MEDKNIFNQNLNELTDILVSAGEKKFRAKQVYEWIHNHPITSYDDMNNVPKSAREFLAINYPIDELRVTDIQFSSDGTRKYLFKLNDGNVVESVLIPNSDGRITACISSQVGCSMGCAFCATGFQGFKRNLSSQEIFLQISAMEKDSGERVGNVVVMGQGEPFLNYENTIQAIKVLNRFEAFKIAARKITVSTCGVIQGIKKFSEEPEQFGLAISLHSAVQSSRNVIMPNTKNMPLYELSEAINDYIKNTNRRVTFEYILLKGINEDDEHLKALIDFCDNKLCHVNLLQFNKVDCCDFQPSSSHRLKEFERCLHDHGIACSIRHSKGADIDSACGQLSNKTSA